MNKNPAVYILTNKKNGTLYVGVTSDLIKRMWEHKNNLVDGFTKRYSVHKLMWYELHDTMISAITREKTLKNWKRAWKMELIEKNNPLWQDLHETISPLDSGIIVCGANNLLFMRFQRKRSSRNDGGGGDFS
ncbi:MAG: GIY-YIG nuclease family protein [Deltaproteobacteria bacterium]|nr:GIY-YIG nuclease family protein [Deltaproteobacteria bacterium]